MYKKIKLCVNTVGLKKLSISKGSNKRLDEIHAGILNIKLAYLNRFNSRRISIANKFLKLINSKI